MGTITLNKYAFNGGVLSPLMKGRIDVDRYDAGCETLENMLPLIQGPIRKRPGTIYVANVTLDVANSRLIPFEFSETQAYVLEFTGFFVKFYTLGGLVLSGGGPYLLPVSYGVGEANNLDFAQSADVMYLTHPDYAPRKLSRIADDNWTIAEVDFSPPPFLDENDTTITLTSSAVISGSTTITASSALFASTDVGGVIAFYETIESKYNTWTAGQTIAVSQFIVYDGALYQENGVGGTTGTRPPIHKVGTESDGTLNWTFIHDGLGWVKITGYTSDTVVTADIISRLPQSAATATLRWAQGAWSDTFGWPNSVTFFEDRLWFGGCSNTPQRLWASQTADYENFKKGTEDSDSLDYTLNSRTLNPIQWMYPTSVLSIGTIGGEFIASTSSINEAITPTNIRITKQTSYGSPENLKPLNVGNPIVFVQRSRRVIREFKYNFEDEGYRAESLSEIAEHLLKNGVVDITFAQSPYQIIWIATSTGELVSITYEPAQRVLAWHTHDVNGAVESLTTIPHWDGDGDVTWMIVARPNPLFPVFTYRHVEYISKYLEDDYAVFSDSSLTYDGAPATVISGLLHLSGYTVSILADGAVHPNKTVSAGGEVTLDYAASIVTIGLPYTATVKDMPLSIPSESQAIQGKNKRIANTVIKLNNTGPGLFYGTVDGELDEVPMRDPSDPMDAPVPLFTGDTELLPVSGTYSKEVALILQHTTPLPCTIVSTASEVRIEDN